VYKYKSSFCLSQNPIALVNQKSPVGLPVFPASIFSPRLDLFRIVTPSLLFFVNLVPYNPVLPPFSSLFFRLKPFTIQRRFLPLVTCLFLLHDLGISPPLFPIPHIHPHDHQYLITFNPNTLSQAHLSSRTSQFFTPSVSVYRDNVLRETSPFPLEFSPLSSLHSYPLTFFLPFTLLLQYYSISPTMTNYIFEVPFKSLPTWHISNYNLTWVFALQYLFL